MPGEAEHTGSLHPENSSRDCFLRGLMRPPQLLRLVHDRVFMRAFSRYTEVGISTVSTACLCLLSERSHCSPASRTRARCRGTRQ